MRHLAALYAAPLLLAVASTGHAEALQCTPISSVPATLSAPGSYCLVGDLVSTATGTDSAITIDADYVTLDLNGHSLVGPGSDTGGRGIFALAHRDITVRNGKVRGFSYGVWLLDKIALGTVFFQGLSSRHEVSELRIEDVKYGISVTGGYSRIHGNRVLDAKIVGIGAVSNAPGTAVTGAIQVSSNEVANVAAPAGSTTAVFGINVGSPGSLVQDNAVTTVRGPGGSAAIYVWNPGTAVSRNRETDLGGALAISCAVQTPPSRVEGNLWVGSGSPPISGCSQAGDNW